MVNDYFLLYHGEHLLHEDAIEIDEKMEDETFFEISALFLSLNRKNFETMSSLEEFESLARVFTSNKIQNLEMLYHLQYSIIKHFLDHRTQSNIYYFHYALSYLQKEGLLSKISYEKLISLFDPALFNKQEIEDKETLPFENFHTSKAVIFEDIAALKELLDSPESLDETVAYLNAQKFSIGITGVMNAGKSTMLNALMKREILGTNVVPETANLTIIKYAQKEEAKVVYWNKQQWQHIVESAKSIEAIDVFVQETKKYFKENLDSYILEQSREDIIEVEALSSYTSATLSEKKCNLVQHVELGVSLPFLEEGIEIVDTPGLDDIVIQREEITKEYLSSCDVMLHLMNVSQSATQKDVEFIIEAVLYQNITKVLVVLTRIDQVSSKDVEEVIAYTKESISKKLQEQKSSVKLDLILNSLHFIAISAKMALFHTTGRAKEAQNAGYSMEKTGLLEVESYLQETLFGRKNERSSLIIHSAKNRLATILQAQLEALTLQNSLLFKSEDEIKEELEKLKARKSKQSQTLERLQYQITSYETEMTNYLQRLQLFLQNELKSLQTVMKQRLIDETRYSLEKDKKAPKLSDLERIIESALKHGLMDMIREYRYKFIKKSSKISEIISLQYEEIEKADEAIYGSFNHEALFGDAFNKGFLTANNTTLIKRVSKLLQATSLSDLLKTEEALSGIIQEEFVYLEAQVTSKALSLSETLLEEFFKSLKAPIDFFQKSLAQYEELLESHILITKENETSRYEKSVELHERIKSLKTIAQRYGV